MWSDQTSTFEKESQNDPNSDPYEQDTNEEFEFYRLPSDSLRIERIVAHRIDDDGEKSYLVKLRSKSYRECQWIRENEISSSSELNSMINEYKKKNPRPSKEPYFNPAYVQPERIVFTQNDNYLVKWQKLDFDQSTWETPQSLRDDTLIQNFEDEINSLNISHTETQRESIPKDSDLLTNQYHSSKSGKIVHYSFVPIINSLLKSWKRKQNRILSGSNRRSKACQLLQFINRVAECNCDISPALFVTSPTEILNWEREIYDWTNFREISYVGSDYSRKLIQDYIMRYPGKQGRRFDILVTSPDYFQRDFEAIQEFEWKLIVIDEPENSREHDDKFYQNISTLSSGFKIILINEVHFPSDLSNYAYFLIPNLQRNLENYSLQKIIKPLIMETNSQVQSTIKEIIFECPITPIQKEISTPRADKPPAPIQKPPPEPIETTQFGEVRLPILFGQTLKIVQIGKCITDRPLFHNDRYIYPAGFISEKLYASLLNPNQKEWYRSMIIDRGGDGPVFRVEMKKHPKIFFEGDKPSNPWVNLVKAVDKKKARMAINHSKVAAVSGPKYFGLCEPLVLKIVRSLPGAELILNASTRDKDTKANNEIININNTTNSRNNRKQLKKIQFDFHLVSENELNRRDDVYEVDGDWMISEYSRREYVPLSKGKPLIYIMDRLRKKFEAIFVSDEEEE
ncbi:F/Y-rich N-terminus family protein [Histomonas meleagridis]|uniref:F/Y-rich N-terminus family protein n=1 Tax=Histomonas meleagridis TaxID=135588 RepID=UPI0035597501|nr:F/Y-rich N-terminus family protein [Histomonas meleagridis]KAH0807138.1 F/Y-rich N-terminus family protein [Histomonas meleagridis]